MSEPAVPNLSGFGAHSSAWREVPADCGSKGLKTTVLDPGDRPALVWDLTSVMVCISIYT